MTVSECPIVTTRTAPAVLVVDDEPGFSETLADILTAKGYRPLVATSGAEAIRTAQQSAVELALVDLRLPDLTGIEVLDRIRNVSPRTKVIILTGNATLDTALRALNLGAFGYIVKPYDIDRLFLLIEKALASGTRNGRERDPAGLARLVERSATPMFAYHPDSGQVTAANPALASLFGLDEAAGPGGEIARLFGGGSRLADHLALLKRDGHATSDISIPGNAGPGRWYQVTSSIVQSEPQLAFAALADITDRRTTEEESRRSHQYFEAIFENLAAGVAIIDSQYVIRQANPAFARFYRSSTAGLVGRRCHEVIHHRLTPCSLHGEVCPIASCLASGTTVSVQHRHFDADRRSHYHETTITPLHDSAGTTVSFIAIYADFTIIKRAHDESQAKTSELTAQQERLAAQTVELEKANAELLRLSAAKDDFVSLVSHELRTPLTAISEGINLVADGSLGPLGENQSRFLNVAYRNCVRLSELINDLLDLSKMESGHIEVRPDRFDVGGIVRETAEVFAPLARDRGLDLRTVATPGPVGAFADERLFRRSLANLINNAIKFTDSGSITLRIEAGSQDITVSVADTGIGIPAESRVRIFERFHQVQQHNRNRPAGTGLGLALTRQMVEMNGGRISFTSAEGGGTTFVFTLPADSTAARTRTLLDSAQRDSGHATIVLVRLPDARATCDEHGEPGVKDALDTIESIIGRSGARPRSWLALPETGEFIIALSADDSAAREYVAALRAMLDDATFIIRGQVTAVRTVVTSCPLDCQRPPSELLFELRRESTDA